MLFELVLKIGALLAFCGGPLMLADALKPSLGDPWNFVVAFTPVALIGMGAFSLYGDEHDGPGRFFAHAGMLGVVLLACIDAWGLWTLLQDGDRADAGLFWVGLVVGLGVIVLYTTRFRAWLAIEEPTLGETRPRGRPPR